MQQTLFAMLFHLAPQPLHVTWRNPQKLGRSADRFSPFHCQPHHMDPLKLSLTHCQLPLAHPIPSLFGEKILSEGGTESLSSFRVTFSLSYYTTANTTLTAAVKKRYIAS